MRRFAAIAITLLTLNLSAGPASACINDFDTLKHERQFKSLYESTPTPEVQPSSDDRLVAYGGSAAGLLLLGAAGYMGLMRRRA